MRKPLVVREFDMIMSNPDYQDEYAFLPVKQFGELNDFLKGFAANEVHADALEICKVGYRRNIGNTVSVCNYVGTIQTQSGQQIEILPKISLSAEDADGARTKRVFLKMLRSVKDLSGKVLADAKLQTERMNLYEIFINMYLQEVDRIVKRGLKADYIRFEDNLNKYKGKMIVKEHIKHNMAHKERFYVAFDEFHVNRPENRLVKATLEKLIGISKSSYNQKKIRELLLAFEMVKPSVNHMAIFSKVTIDRGNQYYESALMWSKVFLMNKSFFTYSGGTDTRSILFPMERVFESYVAKALKNAVADTGWVVKAQAKGKYLFDNPHIFALRPDLLVTRSDGTKIVLDTKWKRVTPDSGKNYGISQSDMYQMYAYAHRFDSPEVWLLYPLNDEMRGKEEKIEFLCNIPDEVYVRVFLVDLENIEESMLQLKQLLMENHL